MEMKDRITLQGIQVYAHHGVLAAEKQLGQHFVVDVVLFGDFSASAKSDNLEDAVDYSQVYGLVTETMKEENFDLIERAAGQLCAVLLKFLTVDSVEVTVEKSNPPIPGFNGQASVTLHRDRQWLSE